MTQHTHPTAVRSMALSATLHCLTGCALGEVLGLLVGTALGWSAGATIALAVALAFVFGYALSTLPLLRAGLGVGAALSLVLAADTLSIATMEVVDNAVMALVPGAMGGGLDEPVFWLAMVLALAVAFAAAYPVNRLLIGRGRGHALTHAAASGPTADEHGGPGRHGGAGADTRWVAVALAGFLLGGLVAAVGAQVEEEGEPPGHGASVPVGGAPPG